MSNPFSSRFIKSGAIPFFGEDETIAETLGERFEKNGRFGQIIGPHGTGKTTLLGTLLSRLVAQGRIVIATSLHDRQRRLPKEFLSRIEAIGPEWEKTILVLDGYEQLGYPARFFLRRLRRTRRLGLLLTSHRPIWGVPILHRTAPDFAVLQQTVQHLLRETETQIPSEELKELFDRFSGNIRLVLLELYDRFEAGRSIS